MTTLPVTLLPETVSDPVVFSPYNSNNIEITEEDVISILTEYGLPGRVTNMNLYKRAFIHRSYIKKPTSENVHNNITLSECPPNCIPLSSKSNERLEFLGDGILEASTKCIIYTRFPKEQEGFMTDKKIELVKNETIGHIAIEMKLNKWLILSKHAEEKNIRNNVAKMGCVFESFIGALFLDMEKVAEGHGFMMAYKFIENVYSKYIDWSALILNNTNYKNILQVKIQKEFKVTPYYLECGYSSGIYHMGVYLCIGYSHVHSGSIEHSSAYSFTNFTSVEQIKEHLEINGKILMFLGEGRHKMKKKAEQEACFNAIQNLLVIKI
jgi:dsRNA-specific ribonuclease